MMGVLLAGMLTVGAFAGPKEVVLSYLEQLSLCLNTGSSVFVKELVEEKVARRLQVWLDAWRFSGYAIQARLLKVEVVGERVEDNSAEVRTHERWTYRYVYLSTGEEALSPQLIDYDILYRLRKGEEGWRISSIEILKEVKVGCGKECG